MTNLIKKLQAQYGYAWVVLRGLVRTDFRLRYQGSFLGIAWSVLKPLMMFCVMYVVFGKFLRMSDDLSRGAAAGHQLVAVRDGIHQHRSTFGG